MKNILLLIGVYFCISSCCDRKSLGNIFSFKPSELAVNPYKGNEILKFIDDNGNSYIFNGEGRHLKRSMLDDCIEGCCDYLDFDDYDYAKFERYTINPNGNRKINDSGFTFQIDNSRLDSGKSYVSFRIYWWVRNQPELNVGSICHFPAPVDSMKIKAIQKKLYKDEIELRGQRFKDIYTIPGVSTIITNRKRDIDTLYFSTSQGVVGIKFLSGDLWLKAN
jgi:hypothetical protein